MCQHRAFESRSQQQSRRALVSHLDIIFVAQLISGIFNSSRKSKEDNSSENQFNLQELLDLPLHSDNDVHCCVRQQRQRARIPDARERVSRWVLPY